MKRGRRQIVNRNPFADDENQNNQTYENNNFTTSQPVENMTTSYQGQPTTQQQVRHTDNIWDTAFVYERPKIISNENKVSQSSNRESNELKATSIIQNKNKQSFKQQETIPTETDQKKRKLEMLKQKYLKKAPQNKNEQIDIKGKQTPISQPSTYKEKAITGNLEAKLPYQNIKADQPANINVQQQSIPMPKTVQEQNRTTQTYTNNYPDKKQVNPIKNNEKTINQKNQNSSQFFANLQNQDQQINNQPQQVKNQQKIISNIPKQRIPPPPIQNMKKGVPPPPVQKNNIRKIIQKKIQQPPVYQQQIKQEEVQQHDFKDPFQLKGQYPSKQLYQNEQTYDSNPSQQYDNVQEEKQQVYNQNHAIQQQQSNPYDEIKQQPTLTTNYEQNVNYTHQTPNIKNAYSLLLTRQFQQCLHNLNINFQSNHTLPSFQSKNKNCNNQTKLLLQALLFKNRQMLNSEQKQIVLDIAVEFYYDNPKQLKQIFILILGRLGGQYLYPYRNAIVEDFQRFFTILLSHHHLFLQQQINSLVMNGLSFLQPQQSSSNIWRNDFIQLLAFSPRNDKIIKRIYRSEGMKLQNYIAILCILLRSQQTFIHDCNMLILKCINSIVDLSVTENNQIGQSFLEFFNKFSFPENLYQISKQIKVKIIKSISNTNSPIIKEKEIQKNNNNIGETKNTLLGFWNKAVDTIKTVNTLATSNKNNPPPPAPEEKEDTITWDPQLKRYRINGQIPKDQDGNNHTTDGATQQKKKVPPPPPLKGVPRAPPKKGNRALGNRYS